MRLRDLYNLAGLLTGLRLLLAAAAPFYATHPVGPWVYAFALFTDVIDGPVARRLGQASAAGAAWDGWVDKTLHVNLAWSLVVADRMPAWWMLCWFSRELVQGPLVPVLVSRFRRGLGPRPQTTLWGRATSIALAGAVFGVFFERGGALPTWIAGALGAVAAVDYTRTHLGAMLAEERELRRA